MIIEAKIVGMNKGSMKDKKRFIGTTCILNARIPSFVTIEPGRFYDCIVHTVIVDRPKSRARKDHLLKHLRGVSLEVKEGLDYETDG